MCATPPELGNLTAIMIRRVHGSGLDFAAEYASSNTSMVYSAAHCNPRTWVSHMLSNRGTALSAPVPD
jgi:hypothetical protein